MDINIQNWSKETVVNGSTFDAERWNTNRQRTGLSHFVTIYWSFHRAEEDDTFSEARMIAKDIFLAFDEVRKGWWNERAECFNDRPEPGQLLVWPETDLPSAEIKRIVLQSVKLEINVLAKRMRTSIRSNRRQEADKTVHFGPLEIVVRTQAYRGINNALSYSVMLSRILFGENYQKLIDFNIYETGSVALFAIPSAEEAKTIFTVAGECCTEEYLKVSRTNNNHNNYDRNNFYVRHCAAGRIDIRMVHPPHSGNHGYIMSQNRDRELTVHLVNDVVMIVPCPRYDRIRKLFVFTTFTHLGRLYKIEEYDPIYLFLSKIKSQMSYVMKRFGSIENKTTHEVSIVNRLCA